MSKKKTDCSGVSEIASHARNGGHKKTAGGLVHSGCLIIFWIPARSAALRAVSLRGNDKKSHCFTQSSLGFVKILLRIRGTGPRKRRWQCGGQPTA